MFSKDHKVVTFGEILGRLSPPNNLRFSQAAALEIIYGGGEFNVAASLANYGVRAQFISAVPDNAIVLVPHTVPPAPLIPLPLAVPLPLLLDIKLLMLLMLL